MRIANIARERHGEVTRAAADVIWEDRRRPAFRLWFETVGCHGDDLVADPNAFLLAAIVPAFRWGEARVAVEGDVCPRLRDGLTVAMKILGGWWGPRRRLCRIEATRFVPPRAAAEPRTGLFLSGGFDSLASLRVNRRDFPPDHPSAVRDGLFIYGLDIGAPGCGDQAAFFEHARASLSGVAAETGVELIPVRTNVRELDADGVSWPQEWFGAATSAVAHAFSGRLTRVLLAAGMDAASLEPCASHPVLDPCYGSASLDVVHDGAHLSRLDKIRLVSEWETAFRVVRICWTGLLPGGPLRPGGSLNCGRCRKCMRAMMGLLALGRLDQAASFPTRDVLPDALAATPLDDPHLLGYYRELLGPLEAVGRGDLTAVIRRKMAELERAPRAHARPSPRQLARRLDREYLDGRAGRLWRAVRRPFAPG
jgi:hypothetical protein